MSTSGLSSRHYPIFLYVFTFLFRSFEDARDALHSKSRIILFDKPAQVEAVYESASREEYESRAASISPPRYCP